MTIKQFLRRPAVIAKTGLSATTLYNLEKAGNFPQHFMLTPRCAAWDCDQVDDWMRARQAQQLRAAGAPNPSMRTRFPGRGKRVSA